MKEGKSVPKRRESCGKRFLEEASPLGSMTFTQKRVHSGVTKECEDQSLSDNMFEKIVGEKKNSTILEINNNRILNIPHL